MSGASTSHTPPAVSSLNDVSVLFQNVKKYEELNVIGTGTCIFICITCNIL